jgi:biotin synthase
MSNLIQMQKTPESPSSLWPLSQILELFDLPFMDLVFRAQQVFRENFTPNQIQISTLLSIKTGSCPENCSYCSQSAHFNTGLKKEPLMDLEDVVTAAKQAKEGGATRFCMGAAWRGPRDNDLDKVIEMIKAVKEIGMETCVTLGLLKSHQAQKLKEAGLDFYNHNIDTSPEFYGKIITTRTFQDRLDTLQHVQESGLKVCCGGILGMGESQKDRASMLMVIANMDPQPQSVPINWLIRVPGTPLANQDPIDPFDFVRTIAVARIVLPKSYVRLSAGREEMSDELQALCFLAGANSIFKGDVLLTTKNPAVDKDNQLLQKLGITEEASKGVTIQHS